MIPSFWKSQAQEVIAPVDLSENFTRSGGFPVNELAEKSAIIPGELRISPDTVTVFPPRTGVAIVNAASRRILNGTAMVTFILLNWHTLMILNGSYGELRDRTLYPCEYNCY